MEQSQTFLCWAHLPEDLLHRISHSLDDLKCYASARGACTSWRSALVPVSPSLLVLDGGSPSLLHLLAGSRTKPHSLKLKAIPYGARCVGFSHGWLALSVRCIYEATPPSSPYAPPPPPYIYENHFRLFNPITATEIRLPPLIYERNSFRKVVFVPNPARDDFAAATICDTHKLAYVTAGARRWAILDLHSLAQGHLVDVVYREKEGTVYYLTDLGDVHVLRLPERRPREPAVIDEDPAYPQREFSARRQVYLSRRTMPDLNSPAMVEPLLSQGNLPFDHATSFAPPYNRLSELTSVKNLVFCGDNLYQIWRNASCKVSVNLPAGGKRCVLPDEIFVLRHYPECQPCWGAVTDLGGYSVFLGWNNAVSMHAEAVPGLKGDSVYWIGQSGTGQGMVFDMATRRSTPCLPHMAGAVQGLQQSTICWF